MVAHKQEPPWNKGKLIGSKKSFTFDEVQKIKRELLKRGHLRDLVLFSVAIDSQLRTGDLISLKWLDVCFENGIIKEELIFIQEKTNKRVINILFSQTREWIKQYLEQNHIEKNDYLFFGRIENKPMAKEWYRKLVKKWANMIGLNPAKYSGHSTRRTRSVYLQNQEVPIEYRATLLGTTIEVAKRYSELEKALQISKKYPI